MIGTDLKEIYLSIAKGGNVFCGHYALLGSETEPVLELQKIMRGLLTTANPEKIPAEPVE